MYMQSPMPTSADQTYLTCQGVMGSMIWFNQTGAAWASGEMPSTTYNHVAPPNGRSCAIMSGMQMMAPWSGDAMDLPWYMQVPPSSAAPGRRERPGRRRFGPVRQELGVRADLASLGVASRRRGHLGGLLLNESIMRILRSLLLLLFLAAVPGFPVLVSGCSNSSSPSSAQIEASKQEQQLLHDQMQKGFAKRPATEAGDRDSDYAGKPPLWKSVKASCQNEMGCIIRTLADSIGFGFTVDYNNASGSSPDLLLAPSDTQRRMRFSDHYLGKRERWLLLAVVLVLQGNVVFGDSVSSPTFDAEAHAQVCHCGPKCRQASCCCGPRKTRARPPAPPTALGPIGVEPSPCMGSAPCEESGLPTTPSSAAPIGKLAALAMSGHLLSTDAVSFRLGSPPCLLPTRRASRLDRPPEQLIFA